MQIVYSDSERNYWRFAVEASPESAAGAGGQVLGGFWEDAT